MKRIIAFFVRQGVFGDLLSVAVIILGIGAAFLIKREVFPNVAFDVISIVTIFPGASPQEVEKLITNPLEQDLKEVDGIKKLQSGSIEGRSGIVIYLDPDQTTEEIAKSDIQDVVDRFTNEQLPANAEKPLVTAIQSKQAPIIEVSVAGEIPPLELRAIAKQLEYELERVSGVARVVQRGLRDIEIRVEADQQKLSRYRLSLDDLVDALKRQNVSIPGGTVEPPAGNTIAAISTKERIVRTVGDFANLDDVRKTIIRANDLGQALEVADVAKVFYDLERADVLNHTNGLPALSLTVLKKENADAIDLVDAIKQRVKELHPKIDPRVKISYINDFSEYIRRRLSILTGNLTIGLSLVLLLLPLMIPFRFALLIALGEPFAFLGTIWILHLTGHSINLISMLGLIIVSGILVDDSIVVTENAVRLVEEGKSPKEAAIEGTYQILSPVTASVLATTTAFLPMLFMSGIFGKFIREVPIAVITALGVSLIETFFILPAHIAHWIRPMSPKAATTNETKKRRSISDALVKSRQFWDQKVVPLYMRWLNMTLKHRYLLSAGMIGFFIISIVMATTVMRFVLFPPEGVEIFFIRTQAHTGTSIDQHSRLLAPIEKLVAALPANEIKDFTTTIGIQQQDPNDPNTQRGSEFAQIAVFLTPENDRERTAAQVIEDLRKQAQGHNEFTKITFARVNPGPPTGKPVSLGVRGQNYDDIMAAVQELKKTLAQIKGVTDIADSYVLGKEELQVNVKGSEAAAAALSVAAIGNTVRAAYEGLIATTVQELDEEIDVRVSLTRAARAKESSLEDILIPNRMGNLVPLSKVAHVAKAQGLSAYEHEANQRQIKVTSEIDTKITSAVEVNNRIREMLGELKAKHPKVAIAFGGEDEDTQESMASLVRAFMAAIMGIFLILVMTFKRLLQPMVILLTVPLGIIAVIWAFFLHGLPLSFMGMLGIIALSGVIVNNAIVFVDFVNQQRTMGKDRWDSIKDAAQIRLRPIFLTTITTVIGILPTAYGIGGIDKFVVPIAMALGWGLLFGSILTMFVFPSALAILDDLSEWLSRKFPRLTSMYSDH